MTYPSELEDHNEESIINNLWHLWCTFAVYTFVENLKTRIYSYVNDGNGCECEWTDKREGRGHEDSAQQMPSLSFAISTQQLVCIVSVRKESKHLVIWIIESIFSF